MTRLVMGRGQDDAVDAALAQHFDGENLLFLGLTGVGDDQQVALAFGLLLRAQRERRPERVAEVADREAQGARTMAFEVPRQALGR